jgi:hypothetical protein
MPEEPFVFEVALISGMLILLEELEDVLNFQLAVHSLRVVNILDDEFKGIAAFIERSYICTELAIFGI